MKLTFITLPRLLNVVGFGRERDAENYVGPFLVVNYEAINGEWELAARDGCNWETLMQWILKIDI